MLFTAKKWHGVCKSKQVNGVVIYLFHDRNKHTSSLYVAASSGWCGHQRFCRVRRVPFLRRVYHWLLDRIVL